MGFDYSLDYRTLDLRQHPELYRVGKGEQGVLLVEPYKSEILPHWRFRTPEIALESATAIWELFCEYLDDGDLPGADMARKYLQMGWTRARRYANHPSGRKYDREGELLPYANDRWESDKAQSAAIFYRFYRQAMTTPRYVEMRDQWRQQYG